jgi:replicative DNA helicase
MAKTRPTQQTPANPPPPNAPSNLEAERSVLGVLLVNNDAFDQVVGIIHPEDFYRVAHATIFRAMWRLHERRSAIDLVTLREMLGTDVDDVGGPSYITSLADGVPRSTNVKHYARIVYEHSVRRKLIDASNQISAAAYAGDDPDEIIRKADQAILDAPNGHGYLRMGDLMHSAKALFERLEYRHTHKGELSGIDTGFKSINELTLGWQPGDLIVVAARPSVGKTTLALNSSVAAARTGKRVLIVSLEMRKTQLEDRILASVAGVDAMRIRSGYLGQEDFGKITNAIEDIQTLPVTINDKAGMNFWEIRNACKRLKAESGLDLVFLDYVQLVPAAVPRRGSTRNEEITEISRRLKTLADELTIPVVLLSQLKRIDGRKPTIEDLRESGSLEQDADLVLLLHRKNHREGGGTSVSIAKQRNGPGGSVSLTLDRDTQTFSDAGEEPAEPPDATAPVRQRSFKSRWR